MSSVATKAVGGSCWLRNGRCLGARGDSCLGTLVPLVASWVSVGGDLAPFAVMAASDLSAMPPAYKPSDCTRSYPTTPRSKVLARLPLLHPEGLHREDSLGPGDELKRAVKIRSGLVHRRTACMARLDALLEILGPAWIAALGSDMTLTALRFLARYANPVQVRSPDHARRSTASG